MSADRSKRIAGPVAEWFRSFGIRTKILGMVLALTLALGVAVAWQVRVVTAAVLEHELDARGAALVDDLAARVVDPILLEDRFSLFELLSGAVANHEDVAYAFVVGSDGVVSGHSFGADGFPVELLAIGSGAGPTVYDSVLGRVHDFSAPVLDGRLGEARIGVTEERLGGTIAGITVQMLLTTVVVALAGVVAAVVLTRLIVGPITSLVEATRRVGRGELSTRAEVVASDEIGILAQAFNTMVSDLEDSRRTIDEKEAARTRLLDKLITAQEEERKRFARELHDGVGQSLNSLVLGLSSLAAADGKSASQADRLRQDTLETLQAVRQLSRELRPSVLDDLGLSEALSIYASEVTALHPGLTVDTHLTMQRRLEPSIETAVYRMIQEGVTNAARHSGGRLVSVVVDQTATTTRAIVEDDGEGFDVDAVQKRSGSVGLHAIRERAELVGGSVEFESGGTGTTVFIEVPA